MDGELLVYDEAAQVACRLNPTAAAVWRACDGRRSVAQIAEVVAAQLGGAPDLDLALIALDTLVDHDLMEDGEQHRSAADARMSRRRFLSRVGLVGGAAAMMPVVYGLAVPTPAAAASAYALYY